MSAPPPPPAPPGQPQPRRSRVRRALQLGGAISVLAICAVLVTGLIGWNIGVQALVIGLAAALIPVPVLILAFLWLDRYEPEPMRYLIFCLAWGAFVATAIALGVNSLAAILLEDTGRADSVVPVAVAPVIEELGKVAAPLLLWWFRRAVSGVTDGIVFCGMSATGFAMVENILYLGGHSYRTGQEEFGTATGLVMLIGTFIVRILLSGFAHPLFTAAAGVGIGVAARSSSRAVRWLAPIGGVVAAMMLHATWNLMAVLTSEAGQPLFFLYGYVAVMMPIFFGMVGLAVWLRAREGQVTQRTLPDYVQAGWLSPPEVAALRSLGTRHSARRWARRVAGEPGVRAMRGFQFAATRLALLRDGIRRGVPAHLKRGAEEEQALLAEIARHREVYVGRDPAVPPARWDGWRYEITFPDGSSQVVAAPPEPVVPLPLALAAPGPAYPPPPPPYPPPPPPGYPPPPYPGWPPGGGQR